MAVFGGLAKKKAQPGTLPAPAGGLSPTDLVNQPGQTTDPAPDPLPPPVANGGASGQGPEPTIVNQLPDPLAQTAPAGPDYRGLIDRSLKTAYNRNATDTDYSYWLPKLEGDPNNTNYWEQRLLGQGAGGADVATSGPYAGQDAGTFQNAPSLQSMLPEIAQASGAQAVQSASQPASQSVDPFASVGGGVYRNGGWVPVGHPDANGASATAAPSASASPTTPGQPSNTPAALDDAYRQAIAGLLDTPQTVTPESLQSDPATQAYNLGAQRSEERQRAQIAEQDAFDGTNQSGGMDTELAGLRQQRGQGEAAFVGNLAMQKMQDNRAALVQGIQAEQQRGEFDKSQALQKQLADLDAQIRREGLSASNSQASADLDLRSKLGLSGLDLQRLALELSNTQQNNRLGYDYTALEVGANDRAYTGAGF